MWPPTWNTISSGTQTLCWAVARNWFVSAVERHWRHCVIDRCSTWKEHLLLQYRRLKPYVSVRSVSVREWNTHRSCDGWTLQTRILPLSVSCVCTETGINSLHGVWIWFWESILLASVWFCMSLNQQAARKDCLTVVDVECAPIWMNPFFPSRLKKKKQIEKLRKKNCHCANKQAMLK